MKSCGYAFINTFDFLEECILGLILIFFPNYWLIRNKVLQRKAFMLLNFVVCSEGQNEDMFWKTWEMGSFDVPGTAQQLGSVSAALHSLTANWAHSPSARWGGILCMQCQDVPCLPLPFLQYFNFTIPAEQKLSAAASGAALSLSEWLFSLLQGRQRHWQGWSNRTWILGSFKLVYACVLIVTFDCIEYRNCSQQVFVCVRLFELESCVTLL